MPDDEKRHADREPVTLFVEYEGVEALVGDFTENLSSGGTFVATSRELPIGTRVQLLLSFPGLLAPIAIEGAVRWRREVEDAEGDAGAGIEFTAGPARDQLAAIVDTLRRGEPGLVTRSFRVLVVEDNKLVARLITEGLRGSSRRNFGGVSFAFRNAAVGRAAVEILRRETFDALIIDMNLPVLEGAQVIHQARTELGLTDLPIIAVSAGGDAARHPALDAGANVFLGKPMQLRQIIETMQRLLQHP